MKDFSKCDFTIQNQTTLDSADASVYALIDHNSVLGMLNLRTFETSKRQG